MRRPLRHIVVEILTLQVTVSKQRIAHIGGLFQTIAAGSGVNIDLDRNVCGADTFDLVLIIPPEGAGK